ncbi:MAG: molybdopterin molybdotransferase MoeA [Hyphomicrobiales bacterium]|nr:molybdopterin molybdotransferase MoeA [Hyphomicrobiales bacterium]
MSGMITVEDALARVLASAEAPLNEERVALDAAHGRVLARDLAALRTQPPFANSAMDGYALRAADTLDAATTLTVVGESAAGRAFGGAVDPGQAIRIFTGAPMPEGADAIVVQEEVRREGDRIALIRPVAPGDNLRPSGMDFREGDALIPAGRRLTPRDVALAAAGNHAELPVRRRARVAILATGDELVAPGGALGPAQIIASNNFAVAGVVAVCGGVPIDLGIAIDTIAALDQAIRRARDAEADVLITLGGASVGDHDLVQKALVGAGMELGFWRIAMRPGKPLMHGRLGAMRVLGLPGNPTSSMVCAILFLRPLLRALHGEPDAGADPSEPGLLGADLTANGPRQDYMRATLSRGAEGRHVAIPAASQDSSLVKTMARAEGLVIRPPRAEAAKAGEACRIIAFATLGI